MVFHLKVSGGYFEVVKTAARVGLQKSRPVSNAVGKTAAMFGACLSGASASPSAGEKDTFVNPVLPGGFPDPSVCRAAGQTGLRGWRASCHDGKPQVEVDPLKNHQLINRK